MAKWDSSKTRIIYRNYKDFVDTQKGRMKIFDKFDPKGAPHILYDLKRFYKYINKSDKILDAGCRDGWAIARMLHDGYHDICGIDVVPEVVKFCKKQGFKVSKQSCENLKFADDSLDAIFCRHTLEHVMNPQKAIHEFIRVIKPDGIIFVVIPIEPSKDHKRDVKFGHSYVFEKSSEFNELIENSPLVIRSEFLDERTLSGRASTFILTL